MMKTTTALYERISQERQSEIYGLSIQHQKEILEKFANQNGFTPFRHFTDIGVSGTHFDRPGDLESTGRGAHPAHRCLRPFHRAEVHGHFPPG